MAVRHSRGDARALYGTIEEAVKDLGLNPGRAWEWKHIARILSGEPSGLLDFSDS